MFVSVVMTGAGAQMLAFTCTGPLITDAGPVPAPLAATT
jgi:hypothetical protein